MTRPQNDEEPRLIPTDSEGLIDFGQLLLAIADNAETKQTGRLNPTAGRVVEDPQTGDVSVGTGSAFVDADTAAGLSLGVVNGIKYVRSADDLPGASNGVRQLEAGTAYLFTDFVTDPATLELASAAPSPLIGLHGSISGYIHTGTSTAIQGTDAAFMMRDFYTHAPGGTLLDLTADQSTEMLVESASYSDAAGLGQIANLGTVEGYRVPTWKGVNFEDFAAGLTLTGTSDKVFFEGCPLRTVTASGVTIIEFDANFECDIVDFSNNYVKDVQSDTVIVDVDPSAVVNDVFQYRGVTHDATVTQANILTGQASVDAVGYRISDSYPLQNSKAFIDYTLDSQTETTITTSATDKEDGANYVRIAGPTSLRGSARFSHSDNLATYEGRRARIADLLATLSLGTGTSDVIAVAWFQNGSLVPGTATRVQMNQQGGGIAKTVTASGIEGEMDTDDEFDVRVANLDSTANVTIGELNAKIST